MGSVFEAVHQYIERRAAIKVLHPDLSQNPQFRTRFLNEARAVNLIKHPGLVEIFEFGLMEGSGTAYIIMEFLEGESLGKRLQRFPNGMNAEALTIGRQIAQAMSAAHQKDIVHRDLKPDNVMLVPDPERPGQERVKVLDFGIAKLAGNADGKDKTETGTMIGTPAYMAPEQCLGEPTLDGKADVYALGVMLYEMLSGVLPFAAQHSFDFMAAHVREEPRPLRSQRPDVPDEVAGLLHSMLLKAPQERPTMAAVVTLLDQLQAAAEKLWPQSQGSSPRPRMSRDAIPKLAQPSGARGAGPRTGNTPTHREQIELSPTLGGASMPRISRDSLEAITPSAMSGGRSGSVPPVASGSGVIPVPAGSGRARAVLLVVGALLVIGAVAGGVFLRRGPATSTQRSADQPLPKPPLERKVRWSVISNPPGAEVVRRDGQVLGSTPWQLERPADPGETVITLRHAGFQDKQILLSHSTDLSTAVTLVPVPPPSTPTTEPGSADPGAAATDAKQKKAGKQRKKKKDEDVKLLID
jgi:serine/threonine-protein kinase